MRKAPAVDAPDVPSRAPSPWETEGAKAQQAGAVPPRAAVDEDELEDGPPLDRAGHDAEAMPDEEGAMDEGHLL